MTTAPPFVLLGRLRKRPRDVPAGSHPVAQCAHWHSAARVTYPVGDGLPLTPTRQPHIGARIGALLKECHPPAILRLVAYIVIAAIKRQVVFVSMRQCPITERDERAPFLDNRDATTAVEWITYAVGVGAARQHRSPDPVQPCVASAMHSSVLLRERSAPAPTRLRVPAPQPVSGYHLLCPAIAAYEIPRTLASAGRRTPQRPFNNCQEPEWSPRRNRNMQHSRLRFRGVADAPGAEAAKQQYHMLAVGTQPGASAPTLYHNRLSWRR